MPQQPHLDSHSSPLHLPSRPPHKPHHPPRPTQNDHMPRIAALRLRPHHRRDPTLELNRDDPILRAAEINAGNLLPRTVADVNTIVVRRGLPG